MIYLLLHLLLCYHCRRGWDLRSLLTRKSGTLRGGSKGVINFPWIFCAKRSLVPVGHFRNISGHLFTWLVCGSFHWRHGLLFTGRIVWDVGFKRSHWIHLGWWSTGSPKLQPFQLSLHSHVTNCRLISSSAYYPWNMTLKYKMQLWRFLRFKKKKRKSYILSRGHSVFRRKIFFWRFVFQSDTPKFRR